MTQKTKLIVGAVVVLGAYYLYTKNKTKMEVADLKDGAETPAPATIQPITSDSEEGKSLFKKMDSLPLNLLRADSIQVVQGGNKFSNFDGGRKNSMFAQYFR